MARSIDDIELLFQIINERSSSDPLSAPVPFRSRNLDEARALPIGFFEDDGLLPVTSETRVAIADAVSALQRAGFRVKPFRPQLLDDARKLWTTFFMQCGAMFYEPAIAGREAELSPVFKEFLEMAGSYAPLTARSLLAAWAEWDDLCRRILEEMRSFPVLLLPVCAVPAFRHGERNWLVDGQQVGYLNAMRYTQWFNLLGAPAAVVPVGQSAEGLPIGVQVAARPFEDEYVLAVARVLDREFGYRVPPLA